jgi:hypothetical protein
MKIKDKGKSLYALCLKSTGEPSVRVHGRRMFTESQAAYINEDILKNASVEWKPIEEGKDGREALRRSAK